MQETVIIVTRPGLGHTSPADADFGADMLDKFLHAIETLAEKPKAICFYTEGVQVLARDSSFALAVQLLDHLGIDLVACGSCLDYYGLGDEIAAGRRSNMAEIVKLLGAAKKVIRL